MLPFDAGSLFATIAYYHATFWPLPWLALAWGAVVIALSVTAASRAGLLLLAVAWIWVGAAWHLATFAGINFAAPLYGAFFVLQGALLAWAAARGRLGLRYRGQVRDRIALALAVAALVGYPLLDRWSGIPWPAVRLPGADPCPTALFTLGILLLADRRSAAGLMVLPVLWTFVAGTTGWAVAIGRDQFLPLAGLVALVLALWPDRRAAS